MRQFQIFLLLALLGFSCSNDFQKSVATAPPPVRFLDFSVDSLLVLTYDSYQFGGNDVQFSFFEKNKVWLAPAGQTESLEFDLKTGRATRFSERFGSKILWRSASLFFHHDPFEPKTCWIFTGAPDGFVRYDNSTKQPLPLKNVENLKSVHSMLFTEKEIWLGTATGLWRFDRSTSECRPVENSPRQAIQNLLRWSNGRILVNQKLAYDPVTACWEQLTHLHGIPSENIWKTIETNGYFLISRRDKARRLTVVRPDGTQFETPESYFFPHPQGGQHQEIFTNFIAQAAKITADLPMVWAWQHYHFVGLNLNSGEVKTYPFELQNDPGSGLSYGESPDDFWVLRGSGVWSSLEKSTGKQRFYKAPFQFEQVVFRADSEHLYFFLPGRVVVVNQSFLKKQCEIENPNLVAKQFLQVCDSLKISENDDWREKLAKVQFLEKRYTNATHPSILQQIQVIKMNLPCYQEPCLLEILKETSIDTTVLDVAFQNLIFIRAEHGDLRGAVAVGKQFHKRRPQAKFFEKIEHGRWSESKNLDYIEAALKSLDSLDLAGLPADVLLFEKAKTLRSMEQSSSYFVSEDCLNFWFSDSLHQQLVQRFPDSDWADDADFIILNNRCFGNGSGSFQPEMIKLWESFLKKYPNSNRRAEALANAAWATNHDDLEDLRKGVQWMKEAARLRPDLFLENDEQYLYWRKKELQEMLDYREIEFSIHLKKSKIKCGEPVEIIFSLKNMGAEEKSVKQILESGYPNFSVEVSFENLNLDCVAPVHFVELEKSAHPSDEKAFGIRKIAPSKSLQEVWDLTKLARKSQSEQLVRFPFDQPGVYKISGFWSFRGGIKSPEVRLEVE